MTQMHWTYCPSDSDHLQQGDILRKSEELQNVLNEVHPHYHVEPSYTHFIVITQSCDLVKRGSSKECNSRYITLAGIRPLDLVLQRSLENLQDDFEGKWGICGNSKRFKIKQQIERLLNNNETEYFYLHPEPEAGFMNPSCAFLRLSIALRAYEHYDTCLDARILSLNGNFKDRLGWQVGYVYSRVGTTDWQDKVGKKKFGQMVKDAADNLCKWLPSENIDAARNTEGISDWEVTDDNLNWMRDLAIPPLNESIVSRVFSVLKDRGVIFSDEQESDIRMILENDPELVRMISGKKQA